MRAASIVCLAVAVVVCAWFALGARQAIETSRASSIANHGIHATAAQEHTVASLVRAARFLNPDKEPDILLGQTQIEHGDFARGRRVLLAVTRSEPQNVLAWVWVAHSGGPGFRTGLERVRMLDPLVP
jgi:hypothetical protein